MPRNGSGVYSRVSPPGSGGYTAGTVADPSQVNGEINDIGTELSNSIDKGGRTTATANLPMGGFRHTNVGNGAARNDYASIGQLQDGGVLVGAVSSSLGTGTCTLTPAITAYVNGQRFRLKWTVDGVGVNNLDINGVGSKSVKKYVNGSLVNISTAPDIRTGTWCDVIYDSASDCFIADWVNHDFASAKAAAYVGSTGTLVRQYNITSASKLSTGAYTVTISNTSGINTTNPFGIVTAEGGYAVFSSAGGATMSIEIYSGTSPVDSSFSLLVF